MGRKSIRKGKSGVLKSSKYAGDVMLANGKRIEVKRRKTGLKTIQKWLNQDKHTNYIFFREDGDRENWIVIMRFSEFVELIQMGRGEDGYNPGG
jgi:hypothetical protein